jgi:Zn-dependent protease/predicted transcriptional regulator
MPGIRLFKVLGIRISIDYTWFIVFFLFAWSLAYGYFPQRAPGLAPPSYILMGAVSSFLLFVCVLIHELAHSYTANRLGLDIREITLFIFGGVAHLTKEPEDAKTELKIAVAGPLASLFLAGFFYLLKEAAPAIRGVSDVLGFLAFINLVLLVFNMIPGFPLDGGRVLRALWWGRTGDIKKATRLASQIGKAFAVFLIVFGFLQIVSGAFIQGLWAILIGAFLQHAAESSYRQLLMKLSLEGVTVGDIMTKTVVTVEDSITLEKAVRDYFFNYHFMSFPAVCEGAVVGLITLNHVRTTPREKWPATLVRDVMERITPDMTLAPATSALHALSKMAVEGRGRYTVFEKGKLVGILSRRDVMKIMEFKAELER